MFDQLLACISNKHLLYSALKQKQVSKFSLDNIPMANIKGIFPFHLLQLQERHLVDQLTDIPLMQINMDNPARAHFVRNFNLIFNSRSFPDYTIDISELTYMSNSSSDLSACTDLESFAERFCPDYIADITEDNLAAMLSHPDIGIIHSPVLTCDHFVIHGWANQVGLMNGNGSHHLAAAKYIAQRLNKPVPLQAEVHYHTINATAFGHFNDRYIGFIIPEHELNFTHKLDISGTRCIGIYLDSRHLDWLHLPTDYSIDQSESCFVLFFEKTHPNKKIISLMGERYQNFNAVLEQKILFQKNNPALSNLMEYITNTSEPDVDLTLN